MSGRFYCDFRGGLRIPLRDGTRLSATLYSPGGQTGPLPCIVSLTPYVSDTFHERATYFASHGFPFLVVDVRGRGNSEGEFRPFLQEAEDGHDVVRWTAAQPFCNGKVAMWGGSYGGYSQWATAKELPAQLETIVPRAAPYIGVDFPMRSNICFPFVLRWLAFVGGRTLQSNIFSDEAFWSGRFRAWHESGLSFETIDAFAGIPSAIFQEWLDHPEPDPYWDAHNPTPAAYQKLQLPILTITGSHDDDQPGALEHYKQHMRNASCAARAKHFLIIGPWDHLRTGAPTREFGGLKFGEASVLDIQRLHVDWYRWTMQDGPKPDFLKQPVAYYVMGAERWKYSDTLEAITGGYRRYFLESSGNANDVFMSGSLGQRAAVGPPDSYRYDPSNTDAPEVEAEAQADGGSLVDQSVTFALRGRQLIYHTEPFEKDTEVSGFFELTAWLAIDCPDTDFYVSIHEITADGTSIRLSTDALRARYREGMRAPKLVTTLDPLQYDFKHFTFVAREVKRGHRLRLIIAPFGRLIEATFAQKNYNAGGRVSQECATEARTVTVRLFHDRSHPSALNVPMGHIHD